MSVVDLRERRVELARTPQQAAAAVSEIYSAWLLVPDGRARSDRGLRRLARDRRRALTALLLRAVHGWTNREISEMLGVTQRAVQLMLRRAEAGIRATAIPPSQGDVRRSS